MQYMLLLLIRENKRKIALSLNMGLLLMGWMLTVTIFFSLVSLDKAGKLINQNAIHVAPIDKRVSFAPPLYKAGYAPIVNIKHPINNKPILRLSAIFLLIIFSWEIHYILVNWKKRSHLGDIGFCIGGIIVCSYLCYILISFIKTFYFLIQKVRRLLFPNSTNQNVCTATQAAVRLPIKAVKDTINEEAISSRCTILETF